MISRGEMGSIVAGVGVTSGALSADIYTTLIIMVATATIVTPIGFRNYTRRKTTQRCHPLDRCDNIM
jgi:Kef-type K+ transport system membrane component KefB